MTHEMKANALWEAHLEALNQVKAIIMQILSDEVSPKPPPTAKANWNRFEALWSAYVATGEEIRSLPPPQEKKILQQLQEGSKALSSLMDSLQVHLAAQKSDTLGKLTQIRSKTLPSSEKRQGSLHVKT